MKKITIILIALLFVGCKNPIEVTSSKKQTVIPGQQNQKSYINYLIEVNIKNKVDITIESVVVTDKSKCYTVDFLLKKDKASTYTKNINEKGTYFIEAALKEGKYVEKQICNQSLNSLIVHYKENGISKKIEITSFIEEEKRRR